VPYQLSGNSTTASRRVHRVRYTSGAQWRRSVDVHGISRGSSNTVTMSAGHDSRGGRFGGSSHSEQQGRSQGRYVDVDKRKRQLVSIRLEGTTHWTRRTRWIRRQRVRVHIAFLKLHGWNSDMSVDVDTHYVVHDSNRGSATQNTHPSPSTTMSGGGNSREGRPRGSSRYQRGESLGRGRGRGRGQAPVAVNRGGWYHTLLDEMGEVYLKKVAGHVATS